MRARGPASGGLHQSDRAHAPPGLRRDSNSFSVGATLKRSQLAQTTLDIVALLFIAAFLLLTAGAYVIAICILFFVVEL